MHKIFIFIIIASVATVSCRKSQERPKDGTLEKIITYRASDGSRANVTFNSGPKDSTLLVSANNQKFQLDKKTPTHYERNGVQVEIKGDSLFIVQDNTVIPLVKDH